MHALFDSFELVVFIKLAMAVLCGAGIGMEREIAGKPAGLRTNILICVGAALFMHLSIAVGEIGYSMPDGHPYGDVTRIAAQIVTGVGFLGAGTIMQARGTIVGLTSAATIWVVAAIGSAVGAGYYIPALGATAMVMVVLAGMGRFERHARRVRRTMSATIKMSAATPAAEIRELLEAIGIRVLAEHDKDYLDNRMLELRLTGPARQFDEARERLMARGDVRYFELE